MMIISTKKIRPAAALALSPSSSSRNLSSNKGQVHNTFNENDIEWMDDWMLRFGGVARLYANKGNAQSENMTPEDISYRLHASTVAVVGLGGVGSWAAESLCRSGVGNIILIDLDDICISNTNRQLHALTSTVGRMKIDEMKRRLTDINPRVNITLIHDFVAVETADALIKSLKPELTACIDAIDGMDEKTALILACADQSVPIITCGGAAGRVDPTQIIIDDLTKVQEDRLLFRCRKSLRQNFGWPKVEMPGPNKKKKRVRNWKIPAVFSTEVQQKVDNAEPQMTSSFRTCDGSLGTAVFVTGTFGFVAATKVIEMIAMDKLIVPKKFRRTGNGSNLLVIEEDSDSVNV
jgi:tRNA A37 threonylcarbamoyladenosine dehydratase